MHFGIWQCKKAIEGYSVGVNASVTDILRYNRAMSVVRSAIANPTQL